MQNRLVFLRRDERVSDSLAPVTRSGIVVGAVLREATQSRGPATCALLSARPIRPHGSADTGLLYAIGLGTWGVTRRMC